MGDFLDKRFENNHEVQIRTNQCTINTNRALSHDDMRQFSNCIPVEELVETSDSGTHDDGEKKTDEMIQTSAIPTPSKDEDPDRKVPGYEERVGGLEQGKIGIINMWIKKQWHRLASKLRKPDGKWNASQN
ncbi:cTPxI [Hypoxylon texense]